MKIRRILTYMVMAFCMILAGCYDDMDLRFPSLIDSDGNLTVRFVVPSLEKVSTRADVNENEVKTLTMIIVDDNDVVMDAKSFPRDGEITRDGSIYEVKYKLDNSMLSGLSNPKFYFIANYSYSEGSSLSTDNLNISELTNGGYMIMSGKWSNGSSEVSLIRNAAKVSVSSENNLQVAEVYSIYGEAEGSSILSGADGLLSAPSKDVRDDSEGIAYMHPTRNTGDCEGRTFVVVKATFSGRDYYYRVDFKKTEYEDAAETTVKDEYYLDLESNHWYQIVIRDIRGAGYGSAEEAAKHPVSPAHVVYDIYDHAPTVYNMVSDGVRELGVSHELKCSGTETAANLYVKLYSPYSGEMDLNEVELKCGATWVSIGAGEPVNNPDEVGEGVSENGETSGKLYKFPVEFSGSAIGDMETELTVSWQGLTRTVPVYWESSVEARDICTASLKILKEGGPLYDEEGSGFTVKDYWSFLAGTNTVRVLRGIRQTENNGKKRSDGLHFPVMYGGRGKEWKYEYELDFSESLGGSVTGFSYSIDDNQLLRDHISISQDGSSAKFTVRYDDADSYDYAAGTLTMNMTAKGENRTYTLRLYHTGFFHKVVADEEKNRRDNHSSYNVGDYLYYEVVPITSTSGKRRYWLDRNLGATSAEMYSVSDSQLNNISAEDRKGGGYYRVAEYVEYENPKMLESVCPPGYKVPSERLWDDMRSSTRYITTSSGDGSYNSYYNVTGVGKVYFPKMMYISSSNGDNDKSGGRLLGEKGGGYYWTETAASGLEKEEIGNWLKAFTIFGNSTYFSRGRLTYSGDMHAMSVRCVNEEDESNEIKRTSFYVTGATHVYLYVIDSNGEKLALNSWPGKCIGDYNTTDTKINFYYDSNLYGPEDIYVIFNYKGADGKIVSMSANDSDNTTSVKVTDDVNPRALLGWKVKQAGDVANAVYNWECNPSEKWINRYLYELYRVYWNKNIGRDWILWNIYNGPINYYKYSGVEKIDNIEYYYYDLKVGGDSGGTKFWCFANANGEDWYCADTNGSWWSTEGAGGITFKDADATKPYDKYVLIGGQNEDPYDTYRVYWNKSIGKEYILWNISNGAINTNKYSGIEVIGNVEYYYYDLKVGGNYGGTKFWCFANANGEDWYCASEGGAWWGTDGTANISFIDADASKPYDKYVYINGRTM